MRPLRFVPFLAVAAGVSLAQGCRPPAVSEDTHWVRDSLAVRIVEYHSLEGSDLESWTITWTDSVRIGRWGLLEGDPEYSFGRIAGVVRFSDGRFAVGDAMSHSIRIFEPEGRFAGSFGRRGRGPGEFNGITGLLRIPGDSLVIVDSPNRLTVLDPGGGLMGTSRFNPTGLSGEEYPIIEGAFADGTLLVSIPVGASGTPYPGIPGITKVEYSSRFYRVDRLGSPLTEFGTFPVRTTLLSDGAAQPGAGEHGGPIRPAGGHPMSHEGIGSIPRLPGCGRSTFFGTTAFLSSSCESPGPQAPRPWMPRRSRARILPALFTI
jgi:hypothetical protein